MILCQVLFIAISGHVQPLAEGWACLEEMLISKTIRGSQNDQGECLNINVHITQ